MYLKSQLQQIIKSYFGLHLKGLLGLMAHLIWWWHQLFFSFKKINIEHMIVIFLFKNKLI
jgi:hypothetical protein